MIEKLKFIQKILMFENCIKLNNKKMKNFQSSAYFST